MSPSSGASRPDAGDLRHRRGARGLRGVRQPARRGLRLGPAAARRRRSTFRAKWSRRYDPLVAQRRVAVPRAAAVRPAGAGRHHRRRADAAAARRRRGQLRRHEAGPAVPAVRGDEPSGSFKDNGMSAAFTHARMIGATPGRLRLDRQHQRLAGRLLLGHRADAGHHLHRLAARSPTASWPRRSTTAR